MSSFVGERPNVVILLTVDCLRVDTAREHFDIWSDSAEPAVFADCFCTGSGTPTSMPGLMQSRLPTEYGGVAKAHPLVHGIPTLAEVLTEHGFECAGWHSNVYTSEHYGYERGFQLFEDLTVDETQPNDEEGDSASGSLSVLERGRRLSEFLGMEATAERAYSYLKRFGLVDSRPHSEATKVVDKLLSWLPEDTRSGKQFGWGHFMDLHSPYLPPKRFRLKTDGCPESTRHVWKLNDKLRLSPGQLTDEEIDSLQALYRANAKYVNEQISKIVSTLKARELWDDALLVITSDHGELFGDTHVPDDIAVEHPNYLTDTITQVPLAFTGGVVSGDKRYSLTSGMDVAPTIVDAAVNIEAPQNWNGVPIGSNAHAARERVYSVTGRGTRQDKEESELIPSDTLHASVRTESSAVLWWSSDPHGPEFYKRNFSALPPSERTCDKDDVPNSDDLLKELEKRFKNDAKKLKDRGSDTDRLDEDATDRLRQLGYLE